MANIKDVAKLANVSVATVSRVINNKGYVNEHTRTLVMTAIEELNYVPNEIARSLYRRSSKIIGIMIPNLKNEFFNDMISGMEEIILKNGFKTMLCTTQENSEREKEYLQMFSTNKVDGLIICSDLSSSNIEYYRKLNIPAITLERIVSSMIPSISSDNFMGGELAAKQLINRNCKCIVQFHGPKTITLASERSKGFLEMTKHNRDITVYNVELDFNKDPSNEIYNFLKQCPKIDGVFAASDFIAAKVLHGLKQLGYRVPEDVQLIGYDNISICEVTDPPLSTIAQPIVTMGELAATTLFQLLNGEKIEQFHIQLPVKFIERESTRKIV